MEMELSARGLAALGARVAVLSVGLYALPVPFRVTGSSVECCVPTWSGVGDMVIADQREVMLVALAPAGNAEQGLRWFFLRGPATVVADPDWAEFRPRTGVGVSPEDLYQLVRIKPVRIEWIDEQAGWGHRETADL